MSAVDYGRQFWRFASTVTIPSRDAGLVRFQPWGTQRYLIEEILRALAEDRREIVVLKARQIGATTVGMLWDAFWLLRHRGLQGQFSANSEENKEFFRDVLGELYKTLPPRYSYPLRLNNRTGMAWANGSRLLFQTAGVRGKGGRGRGLNYHHGTEMGEWQNPDAVGSLRSAFSERHPAALYLWEGTAKGYNHFYDMWRDANRAVTIHPIFLAWWRHEGYRVERESRIFQVYWDGRLTSEEGAWAEEIARRWGVTLGPEQWAWRRWKLAEKMLNDETLMHQEFPTLPEHAFQASGSPFVGHGVLGWLRRQLETVAEPAAYRYSFGGLLEQTAVHAAAGAMAQLTVWEEPRAGAHYIVAADPAYGASAASDRSVVSIWRATRTHLTQVACFASNEVTMQQFAWVTCHLAGTWAPSYFILELNGPGMAVWQELDRLRSWGWGTARHDDVTNAMAGIQNYLYRRADSVGTGMAWQWKTTPATKVWILNRLRDQLIQRALTVRDARLVEELGHVRQAGDRFQTEGHAHDDHVIAAALAVEMWSAQVLPLLELMPPEPTEQGALPPAAPAHERALRAFFEQIGVGGAAA